MQGIRDQVVPNRARGTIRIRTVAQPRVGRPRPFPDYTVRWERG
jgi:hypothetical protein